jgi:TPR repeat protein
MSLPEGALALPIDALTAAAEDGDRDAQYRLGAARFREYQEQGNRAHLDAALRWLAAAAEQGHGLAQLKLGTMYEEGRGVIQDYAAAFEWFRQAAEQGEAEAMFRLGTMYEAGRGVPKDFVAAYVWLNLAAARGETRAEVHREQVRRLIPDDTITDAQKRSRALDRKLPRP